MISRTRKQNVHIISDVPNANIKEILLGRHPEFWHWRPPNGMHRKLRHQKGLIYNIFPFRGLEAEDPKICHDPIFQGTETISKKKKTISTEGEREDSNQKRNW